MAIPVPSGLDSPVVWSTLYPLVEGFLCWLGALTSSSRSLLRGRLMWVVVVGCGRHVVNDMDRTLQEEA